MSSYVEGKTPYHHDHLVLVTVICLLSLAFYIQMSLKIVMPQVGDEITMHYSAMLDNEERTVFDSSYQRNEELEFKLGKKKLIPGLERLISEVPLNGQYFFKVPWKEGYGELGLPGVVPPKTDLVFFIHIVDIEKDFDEDDDRDEAKEDND